MCLPLVLSVCYGCDIGAVRACVSGACSMCVTGDMQMHGLCVSCVCSCVCVGVWLDNCFVVLVRVNVLIVCCGRGCDCVCAVWLV